MKNIDMDEIYKNISPEKIPWNIEQPPKALVELLKSGKIKPCRVIDFGCGTGNYALYLAGKGFDVTGVDISRTAIQIAKENARSTGVVCNFIVADVLDDLNEVQEYFDFAYDWELLHHVFPERRQQYIKNVYKKLKPHGQYLSLCFSEKDTYFHGSGKYRETKIGTLLYFSSEDELRDLFEPYFTIEELRTILITGKSVTHQAICVFMNKR